MGKVKMPFSVLFVVDPEKAKKRLSDASTPDLISLYREEENEDVRQAVAPELKKRLLDIVEKDQFVME